MIGRSGLPHIHRRPSLLAFIRDRLDASGQLSDSLMSLPDEAPSDPGAVRFMAGAKDGAFGHHFGSGQAKDRAEAAAVVIARAAAKPGKRRLRQLYDALSADDVLDFVDPMIEQLAQLKPSSVDIGRIGTWLVEESPDRGPVKVGIALLGITGAPNGSVLHEIGAHEEFTLYSCVGFCNSRSDPEPDLFRRARAVKGWGRIHCIERLKDTCDPAIKSWILRDGFRNAVMTEYLAYIAATTGELATALGTGQPDRELLTAAGEIIEALVVGGPAEGIDDYGDAPLALERWLQHLELLHAEDVADFLAVHAVHAFLEDDQGWESRYDHGWSSAWRHQLLSAARALLERPDWPAIVRADLTSDDRATFWRADQAARHLGIDTFDEHVARIEADPIDGTWFQAWTLADDQRATVLADRATALLDLDAIASGPSTAIGLGPEFKPHAALGWTLQALKDHPGIAPHLLSTGLRSPSIQNRNAALNALEAWGRARWSDELVQLLHEIARTDPSDKVRERAAALLV